MLWREDFFPEFCFKYFLKLVKEDVKGCLLYASEFFKAESLCLYLVFAAFWFSVYFYAEFYYEAFYYFG